MAEKQYYTVKEAMQALGISKVRIAAWIRTGEVQTVPSPFDKRVKLIPAAEIARIQALPRS